MKRIVLYVLKSLTILCDIFLAIFFLNIACEFKFFHRILSFDSEHMVFFSYFWFIVCSILIIVTCIISREKHDLYSLISVGAIVLANLTLLVFGCTNFANDPRMLYIQNALYFIMTLFSIANAVYLIVIGIKDR